MSKNDWELGKVLIDIFHFIFSILVINIVSTLILSSNCTINFAIYIDYVNFLCF